MPHFFLTKYISKFWGFCFVFITMADKIKMVDYVSHLVLNEAVET